jgi:hypothetical protein
VTRHAESGGTPVQLQSDRAHQPAGPIRPRLITHRCWSSPSRRNSAVVQKSQPQRGSVAAMSGRAGRWTAPDPSGDEIDVPLVSWRLMVNPLMLDDSAAAVGHVGSAKAVPVGSGARSTPVSRPRTTAFSRRHALARCSLKSRYRAASCSETFSRGLLFQTFDAERLISPRKSQFGKNRRVSQVNFQSTHA